MQNLLSLPFSTDIWKEGEMYVAYVPQLDVSSCGKTLEQAKKNISDAVKGFLEEAHALGTLEQILEEGGLFMRMNGLLQNL